MDRPLRKNIENSSKTVVGHSGNSDVDLTVNIEIDTKSIAYGMLCSLYARGELTEHELEKGLQKLEKLMDENKRKKSHTPIIGNKPKLYDVPISPERKKPEGFRSWF